MSGQQSDDAAAHFGLLAGLRAPWRVSQYAVDGAARGLHLWVTQQPAPVVPVRRPWFGLRPVRMAPRPAMAEGQVWRHLDCMGFACFVHTVDRVYEDEWAVDWLGPPQMPFTQGLSRQVFSMLSEGLEMPVVCELLRLPFAELWKFKYALDNGLLPAGVSAVRRSRSRAPAPASAAQRAPAPAPSQAAVQAPVLASTPPASALLPQGAAAGSPWWAPAADAILVEGAGVPELADPVWEQLITGVLTIQIKTLGFQLLLSKLRQQVSLQHSDEVKIMKLRELHRYVSRHERVLDHELAQLRRHAQDAALAPVVPAAQAGQTGQTGQAGQGVQA